jgi:uncharacterized membrane protein YraQ (UPF0718 family)
MEFILNLTIQSIEQVWLTLQHNWPFLLVSVVIAALLKLYISADKVSAFLKRYSGAGVLAATAASVTTPLCSCGTTAVVLGMMASTMPWAPIVAFMVASPLTSPQELVYSAGLFGWPFASAFFLISIILGLAGGAIAGTIEKRGWLANQARFRDQAPVPCSSCQAESQPSAIRGRVFSLETASISLGGLEAPCSCPGASQVAPAAVCGCDQLTPDCGCGEPVSAIEEAYALTSSNVPSLGDSVAGGSLSGERQSAITPAAILRELYSNGRQLLLMFLGFAFIGYFLNGLIPSGWIATIFGGGNLYSVPLAATLGLPLYINTETSLPLIRAMLDSGMSQGAALAFMTVGAGTSIGAIAGALTIARWRVVGLVIGVLWVGAILCGYLFDLSLMLHIF